MGATEGPPRSVHGGGGGVGAGGPAARRGPFRPGHAQAGVTCGSGRRRGPRPSGQAARSSFPRLPFGSRLKALRTLSCLGRTEKILSTSVYGQIGLLGETETRREDVAGASHRPGEEPRILSTLESATDSHFPFGRGLKLLGSQQFLFPREPSADVTLQGSLVSSRVSRTSPFRPVWLWD